MTQEQLGYVVYLSDNVGTALENLTPGPVKILGAEGNINVDIIQDIPRGHKFALKPIHSGDPVCKYGARIGTATADILQGAHVHLHNMKSDFDERASTLDTESAAPTDVNYELYSKEGEFI